MHVFDLTLCFTAFVDVGRKMSRQERKNELSSRIWPALYLAVRV